MKAIRFTNLAAIAIFATLSVVSTPALADASNASNAAVNAAIRNIRDNLRHQQVTPVVVRASFSY